MISRLEFQKSFFMEDFERLTSRIKHLETENKHLRRILESKVDVEKISYLEAIIHAIPDIVFLIDHKGTYLDILTDKDSLLYKEASFLIGKTFKEVLPDSVTSVVMNALSEVKARGDSKIVEYQLDIAGEKKQFEARISAVSDSQYKRFVFVVMDVTDRYLLMNQLKTNQFKIERVQEIAKLAYFEWDLKSNKIEFSQKANVLLGFDPDRVISFDDYIGLIKPKYRSEVEKGIQSVIANGGSFIYEYRIVTSKDEGKCHLIHAEVIEDMVSGEDKLYAIFQDVSRIRQLEDKVTKGIQQKEAVLNAIPDMMFIQSVDGVFIDFQAAKTANAKLFSDPDDFLGKKGVEVLPPEIAASNIEKIKEVLSRQEMVLYEFQINIDGKILHFEARMVPSGKREVLSIVREVTSRKEAEYELVKAKLIAEESDRLKSAFLANMSHEIRTPMNGVVGFAELLLNENIPYDEKKEYFDIIEKNSHQLLDLIDDIIDLSKIEANMLKMNYTDFNLNSVIDDLKKYFSKEIQQLDKNIEIRIEKGLTDQQSWIYTDKSRMVQIIQNLLSNAVKFTEYGTIKFSYELKNNMLNFIISDTGIGIPLLAQKYIFERFRRMDNPADKVYRGTGLGLSVTRGLVELLGGEISVKSNEGVGSEFSFSVPYRIGKSFDIPETKLPVWEQFQGYNILIVEDEDTSYQYLASLLKKNGVGVLRAITGYEAIEIVKKYDVNMILMDIQLPELNGYEATKHIKKINPELPVIAQTAFAMAEDRERILKAGCDDYLSKPIAAKLLFEKMKKYLPEAL